MKTLIIVNIVSKLFAFAILLQSIEMLAISRNSAFLKVWNFQNIQNSFPFLKKFFSVLYSKKVFRYLLFLQILAVTVLFFYFNTWLIFTVALIQLLVCMRFRGIFNGGSDMMVFIIATGLIIGGKLGLIYIAIHTCYSYFKAGLVKIVQPSWQSGLAISQFLEISLFPNIRTLGQKLSHYPILTLVLSCFTLAFEVGIPLIFMGSTLVYYYFLSAMLFHAVVFIVFGLNRFFWIWLAAWPAVIYCVGLIKF